MHVYSNGKYITGLTFNVEVKDNSSVETPTGKISTNITDEAIGEFTTIIEGVATDAKEVRFIIWSKADKTDATTVSASNAGGGKWTANLNSLLINNEATKFSIEAYMTPASGAEVKIATAELNINAKGYTIMGASSVTVQQMVDYFNASGKTYPSYYSSIEGQPATIEAFAQLVYDVSISEGVKPEVTFTQIMKETGYLQFGGDVQIEQFNFSGLGATGGGVPGESFSSVRIGILAQVQHLVAYAVPNVTEADLKNQPCVDTRFKWVKKGTAPYVVWLGIQENPSGGGWAAADNYGIHLVDMINDMMN